jgi:hypothetical protein
MSHPVIYIIPFTFVPEDSAISLFDLTLTSQKSDYFPVATESMLYTQEITREL